MSIQNNSPRGTEASLFIRLFRRLDADGSGSIDERELKGHLKNVDAPSGPFGAIASQAASALRDQFDADKDGSITPDEFQKKGRVLLPEAVRGPDGLEKARALFTSWDQDSSAKLDYKEVKAGIRAALRSGFLRDTKAEIGARLALDALDTDRNGEISLDELRHAIRSAQRV